MTEEEAKEKFCPFGRMEGRYASYYFNVKCIGSDCMAWRWKKAIPTTVCIEKIKEYREISNCSLKEARNKIFEEYTTETEKHGYCGRCGKE